MLDLAAWLDCFYMQQPGQAAEEGMTFGSSARLLIYATAWSSCHADTYIVHALRDGCNMVGIVISICVVSGKGAGTQAVWDGQGAA